MVRMANLTKKAKVLAMTLWGRLLWSKPNSGEIEPLSTVWGRTTSTSSCAPTGAANWLSNWKMGRVPTGQVWREMMRRQFPHRPCQSSATASFSAQSLTCNFISLSRLWVWARISSISSAPISPPRTTFSRMTISILCKHIWLEHKRERCSAKIMVHLMTSKSAANCCQVRDWSRNWLTGWSIQFRNHRGVTHGRRPLCIHRAEWVAPPTTRATGIPTGCHMRAEVKPRIQRPQLHAKSESKSTESPLRRFCRRLEKANKIWIDRMFLTKIMEQTRMAKSSVHRPNQKMIKMRGKPWRVITIWQYASMLLMEGSLRMEETIMKQICPRGWSRHLCRCILRTRPWSSSSSMRKASTIQAMVIARGSRMSSTFSWIAQRQSVGIIWNRSRRMVQSVIASLSHRRILDRWGPRMRA